MQSIAVSIEFDLRWITTVLAGAALTVPSVGSAQLRADRFTIAVGAHSDVMYMTDHTSASGINTGTGLDRRSAGGGAARRHGFGVELEYETSRRVAWLASVDVSEGRTHYKQQPGFRFNPPNIHSIRDFTTASVSVGRRRYLKAPGSRARAFYDVQGGYERLSANLLYANTLTDSMVRTAGPMARVRAGSQFHLSNHFAADLSFQVQYASYRGWTRSGKSISGDPTRALTWTIMPALRVRR